MSISSFLQKLKQTPKTITFPETIAVIEENYDFTRCIEELHEKVFDLILIEKLHF